MSDESAPRIVDVRTVGVPVTDQDRALEFYVEKLGFAKQLDVPFGDGKRWIEVAPPGATTTIALVPSRDGVPAGVETGIRFTTQDADADTWSLICGSENIIEEINDAIARHNGALPKIKRAAGTAGQYVIEASTHKALTSIL